jgi:hypothetical protein
VRISESYSAALIEHYRRKLAAADNAESRELAEELQKIEADAALERLGAASPLQSVCQSHMTACRALAAVAIHRDAAARQNVRRILAEAIEREYPDGLEQLRGLLMAELQLWDKVGSSE